MKTSLKILLSIIIVFFYSRGDNPEYAFNVYIWAYVGLVIPMFVVIQYLSSKDFKHLIIFLPLLQTWIYFLQPFLSDEKVWSYFRTIPVSYEPQMAMFSCFGLYALCLGFYVLKRKRRYKNLFNVSYNFSPNQIARLIVFLIVARLLLSSYYQFVEILGLSSILHLFDFTPTLVLALMVLNYLRKGKNYWVYLIGTTYVLYEFFYFVAQTLFTYTILVFLGAFIVYIIKTRKIPIVPSITILVLLIPVYFTRMDYRINILDRWFEGKEMTRMEIAAEGAGNLVEIYSNFSFEDLISGTGRRADGTLYSKMHKNRMEQVSYLGQTVYMHEINGWAYKYGETFWWLPLTPIPRLIIPFKPKNLMGTELAEDYGLKGKFSRASMNFPILVEGYINFGFIGIIIISFFQGMSIRYIMYRVPFDKDDLNLFIFLSLIFYIYRIDSNITIIYGAILQMLVFWYVLLKFLPFGKKPVKQFPSIN